jgi:hypothetical protein
MRKASATAGLLAVVTSGSMLLGGTALAWHHHHHWWSDDDGGNGKGGTATNNCLNVGVPILSGIGVAGEGLAGGASCYASANGSGGDAH